MRFLTGGESHGPGLTILIDNFPAGVPLSIDAINQDLGRRQLGYGRGGRMIIEKDTVRFLGGVRFQRTTGAPIVMYIENRDFKNWETIMAASGQWTEDAEGRKFVRPRPGHADLAGYYKYDHTDLRDVLERASARETASRVAAGAIAKGLLSALGIQIFSHVIQLGPHTVPESAYPNDLSQLPALVEGNDLRMVGDEAFLASVRATIDAARKAGTTLGGVVETIALGVPPGLGSYVQWDRKLDGKLAQALMSIHAVKSVTLGSGDEGAQRPGHEFHDAISLQTGEDGEKSLARPTNRAGGLEGGVTNGAPVVAKVVMKPIATLLQPLESVNLDTQETEQAHFERSDVTAVAACGVVCEAMMAVVLAQAVLEKFGHDALGDIQAALAHYQQRLRPAPVPS